MGIGTCRWHSMGSSKGLRRACRVSAARWGSSVCTPEPPFEWISPITATMLSLALHLGPLEHSVYSPEAWCSLLGGRLSCCVLMKGRGIQWQRTPKRGKSSKISQMLFQPFLSCQRFPPDGYSLLFLLGDFILVGLRERVSPSLYHHP